MVELIVEDQSLDLYPNEVISLTLAINDMASIESREGNYSNKFTIPSTSKNNAILGYPNELNFITGFKPTKSRNARIAKNGLDEQRGFIQVEQYNQKDKEFSVSFFSGNTDWLDDISDKQLRDIEISNYDHIYNSTNVASSFTNTEGYIYPFIHYGRYEAVSTNNTDLINWMPSMYSHTLVRQMFQDIGWKVGGNLFQDPIFLKHILPFSLKELTLTEDVVNGLSLSSKLSNPYVYVASTPIVFDKVINDSNGYGNYDNTTGVYTATEVVSVNIKAKAVKIPVGILFIRINGVSVASGNTFDGIVSVNTILNNGDTVDVIVDGAGSAAGSSNGFYITVNNNISEGMNMPMSSTLPDMTQEEFLQTIFNQFGAVFTSDNISKTVYINKFEKIKDNISNALDWTDKIDLSRDIEVDYTELVSDYSKVNTLGYKENTDSTVVSYSSEVKPFIGNGSFTIDNDFLSKSDELFESEFVGSDIINCFNNRVRLMYVPRYSSGAVGVNSPDVDPKPRCSIVVPNVSVDNLFAGLETSIDIVGSTSTTNVTDVPFTYFDTTVTGIDDIDSINQSLSFGDNITPKGQKNLIETYYQDFTAILNNPRRVTLYLLLNERDINNLDFLIPIYLGGELNSYFFLNKISDYRPSTNGVTKVELVLIA